MLGAPEEVLPGLWEQGRASRHLSEGRNPGCRVRTAVCLLSQRHTFVGANEGLQLRRTRELPPQPHILITRSFYFHGNGRIRDFNGTTITNIGNLSIKPATLPSPVPGEETALAHTTALHLDPAPRPATLRCLLLLPSGASWVSREPPVSAHQGMEAHDSRELSPVPTCPSAADPGARTAILLTKASPVPQQQEKALRALSHSGN